MSPTPLQRIRSLFRTLRLIIPAFICLFLYFSSGLSLTLYNKWLLDKNFYGFDFPVLMICTHMSSNFLLSACTIHTPCINPSIRDKPEYYRNLPLLTFLTRFSIVGVFFGLDIVFTNMGFKYASVSLVEVIKNGVPASLMIIGFLTGRERVSKAKSAVILTLTAGMLLTSLGEIESAKTATKKSFDIRGLFAAIGALVCGTARLVLMEKLLGGGSLSSNRLVYQRTQSMTGLVDEEVVEETTVKINSNSHCQDESRDSLLTLSTQLSDSTLPMSQPISPHSAIYELVAKPSNSSKTTETINSNQSSPIRRTSPFNQLQPPSFNSSQPQHHVIETSAVNHTTVDVSSISSPQLNVNHTPSKKSHKLHPMLSLFYFTPTSLVILLPMFFSLEYNHLRDYTAEHSALHMWQTVGLLCTGASLAFGLNVSEVYVIQATSALTLCVLSVVKFMLVLGVSSVLFNIVRMSVINVLGLCCAVLGVCAYNCLKYVEMQRVTQDEMQLQQQQYQQTSKTVELLNVGYHKPPAYSLKRSSEQQSLLNNYQARSDELVQNGEKQVAEINTDVKPAK